MIARIVRDAQAELAVKRVTVEWDSVHCTVRSAAPRRVLPSLPVHHATSPCHHSSSGAASTKPPLLMFFPWVVRAWPLVAAHWSHVFGVLQTWCAPCRVPSTPLVCRNANVVPSYIVCVVSLSSHARFPAVCRLHPTCRQRGRDAPCAGRLWREALRAAWLGGWSKARGRCSSHPHVGTALG